MRATLPPAIGGSYELRLCRASCTDPTGASTIAVGRLVLADTPIDTTTLIQSDSARRYLSLGYAFEARSGPPNGCFLWKDRQGDPHSYGVIRAGGLIYWSVKGDSLTFRLYRSPDAFHTVTAVRTLSGFEGRGVSSGAGGAAVDWPPDAVVARWLGSPEFSICTQAADAVLADLRRRVRASPPALSPRLQN